MSVEEMHAAAERGDVDALRRLAGAGVGIDEPRPIEPRTTPVWGVDCTPLMNAAGAEGSNVATVEALLALGAVATRRCGWGASALFFAAQGGDAARVKVLLAAGCDPNEVTVNGHSVVSVAARSGDAERVRLVLAAGARTEPPPGERYSFEIPLFTAAEGGSAECVRLLLAAGADPTRRERSGGSALACAGSAEVVPLLVAAGIPVDEVDQHDRTPLDEAVDRAQLDVIRALVGAGANMERRGRHIGETALHRACRSFSATPEAVETLIELGADLFAVDTNAGGCALHHASQVFIGDRIGALGGLIDVLVAAGLRVDTTNRAGQTPLFETVGDEGGEVGSVEALLRHGADPNATDRRGWTPTLIAAGGCYRAYQIVPLLVAAGGDVTRRGPDGRNGVDLARGHLGTWQSICAGDEGDGPDDRARHREAAAEADLLFDIVSRAARR